MNCKRAAISSCCATALIVAVALAAPTQGRHATIDGIVRNVISDEPLAGVRVSLIAERPLATATVVQSGTTDAEGKFTVTGVAPGRYTVSATRPLFFQPRRNASATTLTVSEAARISGVNIFLSPTAVISGQIRDERRQPLRSVRVEALRREYREGFPAWVLSGQATTDDRGEYRIFHLLPGTYYVRAIQSTKASLYYPSFVDPNGAVPVILEAGREGSAIDIEMRAVPEYIVILKLEGLSPGSLPTFLIGRKNAGGSDVQVARAETLSDNTFKFSLPSGTYDILAQLSTGERTQRRSLVMGTISVVVGNADQDAGIMSLKQTVPVVGRIVVSGPVPSPLPVEQLVVTLRNLDLAVPMTFTTRSGANSSGVSSDGTFTLPDVVPGRYRIQVTGLPPETYLVSARQGLREVLDKGFSADERREPLELVLGGPVAVGIIEGKVVNAWGQPMPGCSVVLVPAPERRINPAAFRSSTTDQNGNFVIRSILAGDYKILAWEDLEPGAYWDSGFLRAFETRADRVQVQPGTHSTVALQVIHAR